MRTEIPIESGPGKDATALPRSEQLTRTRSRFTIAVDATRGNKPFAGDACSQYFDTLVGTLAHLRLGTNTTGFVDDNIVAAIESTRWLRNDFLDLAALIIAAPGNGQMVESLRRFLGGMLGYRRPPRGVDRYNPLWCDHFTFLAREIFTNLCAIAMQTGREDIVALLLNAKYDEWDERFAAADFLRFGGYTRSLDEFRARRTGAPEPLPSAELLRDRCAAGPVSFDQLMQADLIICLHSLFVDRAVPRYWLPVTLVCAGEQAVNGFPLFRQIAAGGSPDAVLKAVGLKKWRQFIDRFDDAIGRCRLDRWRLADAPVPFRAFLALGA